MHDAITFGGWLKERRKSLGISHDELAELIGCSRIALLKMESGERRPSRQMALILAQQMKLPEDEHEAFVLFARSGGSVAPAGGEKVREGAAPAPWRATHQHKTNLPYSLTPLIGRNREVDEAREILAQWRVRMLTLTGPPGIGKTRLALQVASGLHDQFDDGVYFVDLAPVLDPDDVPSAIAREVEFTPTASVPLEEALQGFLSERRMLLVLDNFEHLLDAASTIVKFLEASPWLKVLVTSREALHVRGERRYTVQALAAPVRGQHYESSVLLGIPAVALFVERAQAADAKFELTGENEQDVATICAGLEGLPLAIELAAARVTDLSAREMRDAIGKPLKLLSGGGRDLPLRQRTLRSAIEWSYTLLSSEEQSLLRRLSAFAGGFTRDAANAVRSAEGEKAVEDTETLLRWLVNKSLVKRESTNIDGDTRLGFLESIREYAFQMLVLSGEEDEVRLLHARYFLSLAEQAHMNQTGPRQLPLLSSIDADYSNVIAGLNWLLSNGARDPGIAEHGALMASYLFYYWDWRGYFAEGREWVEQALAVGDRLLWNEQKDQVEYYETGAGLLKIRGRLLNAAGLLLWNLGEPEEAIQQFNQALQVMTTLGNKQGMWAVLNNIAILESEQTRYENAVDLYRRSLDLAREQGDARMALTINNLGVAYWNSGDVENARAMYMESLALYRQMDDPGNMVLALDNLGIVAEYDRDYELAHRYQKEALDICRTYGYNNSLAHVLANMSAMEASVGDFASARDHLSELLALLKQQNNAPVTILGLEGLANLSAKQGKPLQASTLWGAAERMREAGKHPVSAPYVERYKQNIDSAMEQTERDLFRQAWNEGRAMSTNAALTHAAELVQAI